MADTTKKKLPGPYQPVDPIAGLPGGMTAGMATIADTTRPTLFHSPVQPGLPPTPRAAAAAAPPAAPAAPAAPGTKIGHATLIPGSGADRIAKSVGGFFDGIQKRNAATTAAYQANDAKQAAAYQARTGQPLNAAAPAPAALAAVPAPAPAASLAQTPGVPASRAAPFAMQGVNPAATPAVAPVPPAVPVAAPVAAAPTLRPGDVNTFTGANGVTRAVPGMDAGVAAQSFGGPTVAAPVAAAPAAPAAATLRPSGGGGGPTAATIGIAGEDERRRDNAIVSATSRTARSRSEREAQAQAVSGINQLFAQTRNLDADRTKANLDANTRRGITNTEVAGRATEGQANRDQRAGEFATSSTLQRDQFNAGQTAVRSALTGEDGTTSLLRNDGSMTPITGADGKPFREMNKTGTITDNDLFSAYSKEAASISENSLLRPEERAAQMASLQQRPEYQAVLQKVGAVKSGAGAIPDAAVTFLKANPDKAADFDAKFGKGASATYLSP